MKFEFQKIKSYKTKTIFTELTSGDQISNDDYEFFRKFTVSRRFAKPLFQLYNKHQNVQVTFEDDANG